MFLISIKKHFFSFSCVTWVSQLLIRHLGATITHASPMCYNYSCVTWVPHASTAPHGVTSKTVHQFLKQNRPEENPQMFVHKYYTCNANFLTNLSEQIGLGTFCVASKYPTVENVAIC